MALLGVFGNSPRKTCPPHSLKSILSELFVPSPSTPKADVESESPTLPCTSDDSYFNGHDGVYLGLPS